LTLLPALCDGRCVRKADPSCVEPLRREIPGLRRAASALRSSRSSHERSGARASGARLGSGLSRLARLNPTGIRFGRSLLVGLLLSGCSFTVPAGDPRDLAFGGRCNADVQCASGACSGNGDQVGTCLECRADRPCSVGSCGGDGRCVVPLGPRTHHSAIGGTRSENGQHIHLGRVAATPVTTAVRR